MPYTIMYRDRMLNRFLSNTIYGKVWWVESLANLVNHIQFAKLKPSKLVVTINNLLANLFICQTFSAKHLNSPNILPTKLPAIRYNMYRYIN